MIGLGIILGHLAGDYILQGDWQARNKGKLPPWGPRPEGEAEGKAWDVQCYDGHVGLLACLVHCTLYTLAVWLFAMAWMPLWGLAACWLAHFAIDRYGLAGWWMRNVSNQGGFATGMFAPWSVVPLGMRTF
jgi:hypothetical protein